MSLDFIVNLAVPQILPAALIRALCRFAFHNSRNRLNRIPISRIIFTMSEETTQNLPNDGLQQILARLDSIDARLTTLENKVDRRLQETRPIWEQVLAKIDNLENEMRNGFRRLERQVGLLAEDVLIVRADQRELEQRVSKLEPESAQ